MSKVLSWLQQLPPSYGLREKGGKSAFICCPYHGEDTPSLSVNLDEFHLKSVPVGVFRCFGCGVSGRWDKLAKVVGLPLMEDEYILHPTELPDPFSSNSVEAQDLPTLVKNNWGIEKIIPIRSSWRHISLKILKDNDVHEGERHGTRVIVIPVYVNRYLEGAVLGRDKPHKKYPSYLNSEGAWALEAGLLGWENAMSLMRKLKVRTLVLVEGARDALYLQQHGIPAIAILGTQAFGEDKLELIYYYTKANKVIFLMDGDKAGRKATYLLRDIFEGTPFDTVTIKLWRYYLKEGKMVKRKRGVSYSKSLNIDPATLPKYQINKLKDKL